MPVGPMHGGVNSSLVEINVTPLVDVMLVLLVIFMITAPVVQSSIQLTLPQTHNTRQLTKNLLVVSVDRSGDVYIGSTLTNLNTIAADLKKQGAVTKQKAIYVRADEHVSWGILARVMDAIQSGGMTQVQMVTHPYDHTPAGGKK
ncbi:MAG: ExbD/TolR family protein [Terriglobales bacterium]